MNKFMFNLIFKIIILAQLLLVVFQPVGFGFMCMGLAMIFGMMCISYIGS